MICNTYIQFFKTIAEPSRVEILYLLQDKCFCVSEIVKRLGKEQSAVSHNLRVLKEKGFVESHPEGKRRCYRLSKEGIVIFKQMDEYIKKYFHKDCKCGS